MANQTDSELLDIRKRIFLTAYHGKSSAAHLASAYSVVEILYALYCRNILRYDVKNPNWRNRDRLILSKGHASLALYQILRNVGFLNDDQLNTFCYPDSILGGEPNMLDIPGVEATTGSLGHGLSYGIGIAIALKHCKLDSKVYVILGDGECQEGSVWEAVMSANRYELDNLIVILDCNRLQKMDFIENTMGQQNWKDKWESFGWTVDTVDGHNVDDIESALRKENFCHPRVILVNTVKGKGVSLMENSAEWHYRMPSKKQLKVFMQELNLSEEELK